MRAAHGEVGPTAYLRAPESLAGGLIGVGPYLGSSGLVRVIQRALQ
jgi:hypothetical protein